MKGADILTMTLVRWGASPSPGVTGYKIYSGSESGVYEKTINTNTTDTCRLMAFSSGMHYIAVSAVDSTGAEGPKSPEFAAEISDTKSDQALITGIVVSSILLNEATVTWTTNQECSGTLLWGASPESYKTVAANNLGTTDHLARITGLTSRTHYVYNVSSTCDGKTINSENRSFNTK
jgi:hypothetical protein